jgi:hypothetical protein
METIAGFTIIQIIIAITAIVLYFKFIHPNLDEPWRTIANIVIGLGVVFFLLRLFGFM